MVAYIPLMTFHVMGIPLTHGGGKQPDDYIHEGLMNPWARPHIPNGARSLLCWTDLKVSYNIRSRVTIAATHPPYRDSHNRSDGLLWRIAVGESGAQVTYRACPCAPTCNPLDSLVNPPWLSLMTRLPAGTFSVRTRISTLL